MNIVNTSEFAELFKEGGEALIPWKDLGVSGFSIVKDYPETGKFKPAKTSLDKADTAVLIKIGFFHSKIDPKSQEVNLLISASKISRYLLDSDRFRYDFEDENSPTEISLELSEKSSQPINLTEDSRFVFNLGTKQIYDNRNKKNIAPSELLKYIHDLHIRTIANKWLKSRIWLQGFFANKAMVWVLLVLWYLLDFLDKKVKRVVKSSRGGGFDDIPVDKDNFYLFYSKETAYSYEDSGKSSKFSLLGSEYRISKKPAVLGAFLLIILFYIDFTLKNKPHFFEFLRAYNDNQVFLASLFLVLYFAVDDFIPWLVVKILNGLLRLRVWVLDMRFQFH